MHPYLKKLVQNLNFSLSDHSQLESLLEQVSSYLSHLESLSSKDLESHLAHSEQTPINLDQLENGSMAPEELVTLIKEQTQQYERQITQLAAVKLGLEDSLSLLNTTLDATNDGLVVFDKHHKVVAHNKLLADFFGISSEEVEQSFVGSRLKEMLKRQVHNYETLLELIRFTNQNPGEKAHGLLHFKNGTYVECVSKPRFLDHRIVGRVWSLRDITDLKQSEEQARHQAYHDDLTGLPNRALLQEQMQRALKGAQHHNHRIAILFMDLDGFKYVNDTLGHDFGDLLLCHAAMRLKDCIRDIDLLARYGGDEFIVMMDEVTSVRQVTDLADAIIKELERPFVIRGESLYMTTSIGISLYPNDGDVAEGLIRDADMAMYHAKAKGRNNYQFFAKELAVLSSHRLSLRNKLKTAIEEEQFSLVYQPKVTTKENRIVGVEALIRWTLPDGQVTPPNEFIPAAEDNGLILPISNWVFEEAIKQAKAWESSAPSYFTVAVNMSARQFQQPDLVESLMALLAKYELPARFLEIEITESMVMEDVESAIRVLARLRRLGIRIAIDDFGTGYSSLGYLKSLPIDCLKIDKRFVDELFKSKADRALVSTIIYLSHVMGVQVVAEGVETEEALKLLDDMTCDLIQGYYFSKPVQAEEIVQMLEKHR
ncbi:sensor domain-containing protein [Litoribrevibacter albus]|uniref:cyclic-guanylate-specific phosphodiesterase n=1 Tax=Litoribrevibacter albus TaxID=1473156 RepID=A0AA37SBH8_9GAMM|nr:EAL domain-containing protein [Litoribrevibacter albus]GLQ33082.1 two-component system response regulator [Litoribrevibacter albus]